MPISAFSAIIQEMCVKWLTTCFANETLGLLHCHSYFVQDLSNIKCLNEITSQICMLLKTYATQWCLMLKEFTDFTECFCEDIFFHEICCQLFPWTVIWLKRLTTLIQLFFIFKFTYIVIWHDSVYSFLKCYYVNLK